MKNKKEVCSCKCGAMSHTEAKEYNLQEPAELKGWDCDFCVTNDVHLTTPNCKPTKSDSENCKYCECHVGKNEVAWQPIGSCTHCKPDSQEEYRIGMDFAHKDKEEWEVLEKLERGSGGYEGSLRDRELEEKINEIIEYLEKKMG